MKKFLYLFLLPLVLTFSCKEPEPEPQPVEGKITLKSESSVVLSDDGDSKQVAFSATLGWTAASSESWLIVEPKSGEAGDIAVTLKAGANTAYDARTATVTLTCDKDTKTIQVAQKQKGALLLTESSIPVGAEGGPVTITAKANADVTAAIDPAAASWITNVTTKGLVDYEFSFAVAANPDETPRSGKIVFSNSYGSETVTIQQEALDVEYNVFGQVTCDGAGVPDVLISDGIEIVKTNAQGNYKLHSDKKWKLVFMTIPSGYEAPVEGVRPTFYKLLSEDVNTSEEVNFELVQAANDDYTLYVLGDIHLADRTDDLNQFAKFADFLNKDFASAPGKVYALTLGDMSWDTHWVANNYGIPEYLRTMESYFANIPFFHTMGNHDNEMEAAGDYDKAVKYTQLLAPTYYSFNLGKIHYIVLDNMDFSDCGAGDDERSKCKERITAEQLEWLKKDLSYVDKSTPIIMTAHEPVGYPYGLDWRYALEDAENFISLFAGYDVHYISGHSHEIFNHAWGDKFTEHNSGSVCGSWWWSGYYHGGMNIAQDGAPGGYAKWTVNGAQTKYYYQASHHDADYQFRAYDMNKVKEAFTADLSSKKEYAPYYENIQSYEDNIILVNVWDYDSDWKVEISESGSSLQVEEIAAYDPLHLYSLTVPHLPHHSTDMWPHFFKAKASAADTPVTVTVTDRYGKVFTEEMTRPKAFSISDYKNDFDASKPVAEPISATSSSLVFGWTIGGLPAQDAGVPYKLALYKDAACTDLANSYEISENNSCWDGRELRFVFGGLQPATNYYFVVTNMQNGEVSDPVEGRTDEFTVVDPSTVSNAAAGTVLLAEDFSEIAWGSDEGNFAAGFRPKSMTLDPLSGNKTSEDGYFEKYTSTSGRLYGNTTVASDKRLFDWGFFGNSAIYGFNGYFRICTTASGARTHLVSPALSGIPEGKVATIDVTVTSCLMDNNSGNDVAVFVQDHKALSRALDPDQSDNSDFSGKGGKFTGATLDNGYPLEANAKAKKWSTKTVRISGVSANDCLLFGSYKNVDTKNRFWISDVKVTLVSVEEAPDIDVSCTAETSSTLVFTWTEGVSVASDIANAYTVTLYKDAEGTVVDQSFDFPASLGAWNSKQPKYVFGGLQPSTDYWVKVKDTSNNKESKLVKATTTAFNVVQLPESITEKGVVLAEDFGEIRWDFENITDAVGFMPKDASDFANTEVNTSNTNTGNKIYNGYHYYSGGEMEYKNYGTAINKSRLKGWLTDTKAYIHPGFIKLGTSSARGWILTPEFTVPEGKKAIVKVTVTAARLNNDQSKDWCIVVLTPALAKADPDSHTASFDWPELVDANYQVFSITSHDSWEVRTVSGLEVHAGDRIAFGGKNGDGAKTGRALISDMIVEVTDIVDEDDAGRTTKVRYSAIMDTKQTR